MLRKIIRRAIFISTGCMMAIGMAGLASAQPLPCNDAEGKPLARVNGNCGVTREGPILKLEQIGYNITKSFNQVSVKGRGINAPVDAYQSHDALWATVTIIPGGFSRWHYHPGVNFLSAVSGKATYYTVEANGTCSTNVISANPNDGIPGFVEIPGQVHTVHNTSSDPVVLRVLFTKEEIEPSFTENADQPEDPSCPEGYNP